VNDKNKIESAFEKVEDKLEQFGQNLGNVFEKLDDKLASLDDRLSGRRRERLERVYDGEEKPEDIILEIEGLHVSFKRPKTDVEKGEIRAIDGIDLRIVRGETLGIVGESGCGKSTLARCIVGIYRPGVGEILLNGENMLKGSTQERKKLIQRTGIIFQDPYGSMNPRMPIGEIVSEPLRSRASGGGKKERLLAAMNIMESCGLQADDLFKFPHQFSGGQRQRICIARALIAKPELVVCDEAVSALDVSIQAQIINLLVEMRESRDLTLVFISHDLDVVRFIADRIAVMYLGKIVEIARKDELFANPKHPYTKMLLESAPVFGRPAVDADLTEDPELTADELKTGCRFRNRCTLAKTECNEIEPELKQISKSHFSACIQM